MKTVALEGIQFDLLIKTNKLQATLSTFKSGASLGQPFKHVGQEVHILLKGEIEVEVAGRSICLRKETSSDTLQ